MRFAVAGRAVCGCGSCNLRSQFVRFGLRSVRFFHRPQKTMPSCSDVSRLQRLSYAFKLQDLYFNIALYL